MRRRKSSSLQTPLGSIFMRSHLRVTSSSILLHFSGSFQANLVRSPITVMVVAAYAPSKRARMAASPRRRLVMRPVLSASITSMLPLSTKASAVTSRT